MFACECAFLCVRGRTDTCMGVHGHVGYARAYGKHVRLQTSCVLSACRSITKTVTEEVWEVRPSPKIP